MFKPEETAPDFPDLGSLGEMEGLLDPSPQGFGEMPLAQLAEEMNRRKVRKKAPPRLKVGRMDEADETRLTALYAEQPLTAEALAYTPELDRIVRRFNARREVPFSPHEVYHHLVRLRKRGVLPRKVGPGMGT